MGSPIVSSPLNPMSSVSVLERVLAGNERRGLSSPFIGKGDERGIVGLAGLALLPPCLNGL